MSVVIGLVMKVLGTGDGAARLVVVAALGLALVAALMAVASHLRRQGAAEITTIIERRDHEAGNRARDARDRLRHCLERGGMPDQRTGKCDR